MIWTDEADRLLLSLWSEGSSLGIVAERMCEAGYKVSRNAVAGRKHRLSPDNKEIKRITIRVRVVERPPQRSKPVTEKKAIIHEIDINQHDGIDYLELKANGCKAILDRPRGGAWMLPMVCGLPRCNEGPYCRTHYRLYTPESMRRAYG
jgi:hypothetical protein